MRSPTVRATRPADVPDLRDGWIADDAGWETLRRAASAYELAGFHTFESVDWFRDAMRTATLWWVDEAAVALLDHARRTMPPTTLTPELIPAPAGFVAFEAPLTGIDAQTGEATIAADVLMWHLARVGPARAPAVSILQATATARRLIPLGRADWKVGETSGSAEWATHPASRASIEEDQRTVAALWILSSQKNLTVPVTDVPPRGVLRRARRFDPHRPDPVVRCVYLPQHGSGAGGGPVDRRYHHRWVVSGHWRQQAYGPGRVLRRPTWIAPHVKGPDDAPLLTTPKVNVWRGEKPGS